MSGLTAVLRGWAIPLRWATAAGFLASLVSNDNRLVHAVLGAAFTVAATGHLLTHTRWIRTVGGRIGRGLARPVTVDAVLDAAMGLFVVLVLVSGLALLTAGSREGSGAGWAGVGDLHGGAVAVLFILVVTHVVRHRRRFGGPLKRRRAAAAGTGHGRPAKSRPETAVTPRPARRP